MSAALHHPRQVLLGAQAGAVALPVCDHYSGVEARMKISLRALYPHYANLVRQSRIERALPTMRRESSAGVAG